MDLCKPASAILLISVAGIIYHVLAGDLHSIVWWIIVGLCGTGVFQGLCYGGLEPIAWVLMFIPVLIVCFFLAVALFASRMRIENVMKVPCRSRHPSGKCEEEEEEECRKKPRHCEEEECHMKKPRCNNQRPSGCDLETEIEE
jgi:uncharacterized membrane protein